MSKVKDSKKKMEDKCDLSQSRDSENSEFLNAEVTDEEDIVEENEKDYKVNKWPEDEDELIGYRVRGKKSFSKAAENLKLNLKKSLVPKVLNNISFNISETRTIPHGVEYDFEVNKDEEKGFTLVKIYGPNKKKKQFSIVVTKSKKSDSKFVEIATTEIIIPLLDMFLSGRGWGSVFKTQVPSKGKEYQCKHCKNKFSSEKTLGTHNKKYHVKQSESKNSVSQIETKVTEGQKENTEIKADQKTEEMEVDEKVQEKEKDDFTSKEIGRLMSIQEKYNETINNLLEKVST